MRVKKACSNIVMFNEICRHINDRLKKRGYANLMPQRAKNEIQDTTEKSFLFNLDMKNNKALLGLVFSLASSNNFDDIK